MQKPFSYTRAICFILADDARTARAALSAPRAEYRWTPPKALAFIEAPARHGKVAAAARAWWG